jgi:hypothetical protein
MRGPGHDPNRPDRDLYSIHLGSLDQHHFAGFAVGAETRENLFWVSEGMPTDRGVDMV